MSIASRQKAPLLNNIEVLGVAAVNTAFGRAVNVSPNVDWNDRTPLTDGYIDLYEGGKQHQNKHLLGRVLPQVKSKSYRSARETPAKFPIRRDDLLGFRRLGGVLFIHACLIGEAEQTEIKYAVLTPFHIDRLLETMKPAQKSLSVRLKTLPSDPASIEQIVRFSWQAQGELNAIRSWESLLQDGDNLEISSDEPIRLDGPLSLDDPSRNYFGVLTRESGLELSVELRGLLLPLPYIGEEVEMNVSAGDVTFTQGFLKRVDSTTVEMKLSEGVTLTLEKHENNSVSGGISMVPQAHLLGRLRDLGFCAALEEGLPLRLGTTEVAIVDPPSERQLKSLLESLRKLHRVLEHLGANLELVMLDDITSKQNDALLGLYQVLFEGASMPMEYREPIRITQPVGNWALELMVTPEGDDEWKLQSLTQAATVGQIAATAGDERFLVTAYEVVADEAIARTLNLDLNHVCEAYERIGALPNTPELATDTVLNFVRASDSEPRRSLEFLAAAGDLNNWILQSYPRTHIAVLNQMQIKARGVGLTDEDRGVIRGVRRAAMRVGDEEIELAVGCAVLLNEPEEVRELLADLNVERRERFRAWPIARLLRDVGAVHKADAEVAE